MWQTEHAGTIKFIHVIYFMLLIHIQENNLKHNMNRLMLKYLGCVFWRPRTLHWLHFVSLASSFRIYKGNFSSETTRARHLAWKLRPLEAKINHSCPLIEFYSLNLKTITCIETEVDSNSLSSDSQSALVFWWRMKEFLKGIYSKLSHWNFIFNLVFTVVYCINKIRDYQSQDLE